MAGRPLRRARTNPKDIGRIGSGRSALIIRQMLYRPDRIAIIFYSNDNSVPMGRLSSDIPTATLAPDEFIVAEEELHPSDIQLFYKTGLFQDTGRVEKAGDKGGPVWKIKAKAVHNPRSDGDWDLLEAEFDAALATWQKGLRDYARVMKKVENKASIYGDSHEPVAYIGRRGQATAERLLEQASNIGEDFNVIKHKLESIK